MPERHLSRSMASPFSLSVRQHQQHLSQEEFTPSGNDAHLTGANSLPNLTPEAAAPCHVPILNVEITTPSPVPPPKYGRGGISEYIVDECDQSIHSSPSPSGHPACRRNRPKIRKKQEPWYCVSRPIQEQTRDIKISTVNRSRSLQFSRLLEQCHSIVEYCFPKEGGEEQSPNPTTQLNHKDSWGDCLPTNTKGNTIRVVFQNVHRSISASDNPYTTSMLDTLNNMEADVFMAAESNVNWKSASNRNDFKRKVSQIWPANRLAFSSSDVGYQFELHEFLPGGTCTMVTDHLSMRVVKVGEDASGLGRWSYITLEGQDGRKITFITAYRICKSAMKGTRTSCMQHKKVIEQQEMNMGKATSTIDTTFLRQKFVEDLIIFIKGLQDAGHAVVLGLDANETPAEASKHGEINPGSISWLLKETGMQDVFEMQHGVLPDSTTTTPGRYIDRVAVSGIPIERVTLLKANEPAASDHLGIVVDLDLRYIFNNACSPLQFPTPRKLTSGNDEAVKKYVAFIQKQFAEHRIVDRCRRLREASENGTFDESSRRQLFSLDRQITEILLGAEKQCSKRRATRNIWSPALKRAGTEIGYWRRRIQLNGLTDDDTRKLGTQLQLPEMLQHPMDVQLCKFYSGVAWKSYRGIQRQAKDHREKFLKERAKKQLFRGKGDVAKAILQIKKQERLKSDYAAIRRGYGIQKLGLATLDTPDPESGGRRLITRASEIHDYLLRRNEKHYSQATFTTFGDAGPGFPFIDPANEESDQHIDAMLDGVFDPWESASPNVREFLQALRCTVMAQLDTTLHLADFIQLFKTIPENTASSVSGLHYGHYRVLSKLQDDTYIRVLFDIVNIAFITHSPLPRWRYATQLMLEKGKGPAIENLRIIQLLEADMNWLLRYLWGRKLEQHAVDAGAYNEAQFASPGKLCTSAILNKVLFFDLLRQTRQCGALMDNDATAAFDRVLPALCVITCRQLGMPKEAQRFFFKLLRQMEFTVTTAHGQSTTTYSATSNSEAPGQGVIQGGGASLPNYKSQQHPVVKAYEANCIPAVFQPVLKQRPRFSRWVSGFSDDMSLFLNELGVKMYGPDSDLPIAQRVKTTLQHNLQKYEEYFFTAGGSLNIKKCFYYLVGFHWGGTAWRYKTNQELQLDPVYVTPTTLSSDGIPQPVHWCEANDAQRTLGSYIAPDGSCGRQLDVLNKHVSEWQQCLQNISSSNLCAKWRSFTTVFLRKALYPLIGHSCTEDDLRHIQKPVDRELLHILGLNEHFPRAVVYAPLLYGGLGCATIYAQHVIDKLLLFVHHIREHGQLRETMLTSMGTTQLECGMPVPFLSLPAEQWSHLLTPTWITHLWKECSMHGLGIRFHADAFWLPKALRVNDICIMDIASRMYDGRALLQINMCRIALKAIFVSDIASVDGRRILLSYFNGKGHSDSGRQTRLSWPPLGPLPPGYWKQWQEFLVRWCGTALRLPRPLGAWHRDATALTRFCFYLQDQRLIMDYRDKYYEFHPFTARSRTRFQTLPHALLDVNLDYAQLVDITYKSSSIYIVSQSQPIVLDDGEVELPVTRIEDLYRDLPPELQRLVGVIDWPAPQELLAVVESVKEGTAMGVSDGSVRNIEDRASHAWIIQAPNGSSLMGKGPVDGAHHARTSHRAELHGQAALFLALSLLLQYFQILGGRIAVFCDNQAVVKKMQHGWRRWRYRHTKGPDGDIQALLHTILKTLREKTNLTYQAEWVQSHQDEKLNIRSLSREAALNVQMDMATKDAYDLPCQWQTRSLMPVLRAEGCAVYAGDTKITSNLPLTLRERWHEKEAREYLRDRHGICDYVFSTVYWQSLRYALKHLSPHRRATAVKMLHRHLPTQEKLYKQGRITMTSLCPRCLQSAETNAHVFRCSHPDAAKQRKSDWFEFWKQLHRARTATIIEQTWRANLQDIVNLPLGDSIADTFPVLSGDLSALLQQAIEDQETIGWEKLMVGMGATAWKTLQEYIDHNNPKPPKRSATDWMNSAMYQCVKFGLRCWKQRNTMVHCATRTEQQQIALQKARDQITAIYQNPPHLSTKFRSIFELPLVHRLKMPLQAAEHWLSLIAHQIKVTQHNHRILLKQHKPMESHLRTMRREARQQLKDRNLPVTPRKAHRRAVQIANQEMRQKLYSKKATRNRRTAERLPASSSSSQPFLPRHPSPRQHPP